MMIILAAVIVIGKGDWLIAGYNTASEQEKQQVNIKRLRMVIATIIVLAMLAIDIPFLIDQEDNVTAIVLSAAIVVTISVTGVIVANTWCKKK
ncbi:MAG: DUF3784 domain-containing protein [Muribaculaceae bacterium]|nr:DUF3784 domain-containing protein [Muribaculaceae bacterium]